MKNSPTKEVDDGWCKMRRSSGEAGGRMGFTIATAKICKKFQTKNYLSNILSILIKLIIQHLWRKYSNYEIIIIDTRLSN